MCLEEPSSMMHPRRGREYFSIRVESPFFTCIHLRTRILCHKGVPELKKKRPGVDFFQNGLWAWTN